jgi:glycosyltransferase involved in cell wall biosynthesis
MTNRRYRLLVVASHPVQYLTPTLLKLVASPSLEVKVAYGTLEGAEAMYDPEFNTTVKLDVPLLEGYDWVEAQGYGLWKIIRRGDFDAVLCWVGYVRASFWISYLSCKFSKSAFVFGTDASSLASRGSSHWNASFKKAVWPLLFSLVDQVLVPSSAGRDLMLSLRLPASRVTLAPGAVDNDWWMAESGKVDRNAIRASWGVLPSQSVVLFCAKLQPWKRPMDLLRAFAGLSPLEKSAAILIFAGEGHQRVELENEATALGIVEQIRFLGFVNQSKLPGVYASADLMVLPSEYEPFAMVVNEASCCGCPVAVSDRVGAARDLVAPVNPQLIFPCGDIDALTRILRKCIVERERFSKAGRDAQTRMETWSLRENTAGIVNAIQQAVAGVRRSNP